MLDDTETTPRHVGNTLEREALIRLLEQLAPVGDVALASIETGCHYHVRGP